MAIWKKLVLGLVAVLVLAALVLWLMGREMRSISSTIDIAAPPEQVWAVLRDVDRWAEWNSQVTESGGTIAPGAQVALRMISATEGEPGPYYEPVIIEFEAASRFRWRATVGAGFIFTNDKSYDLVAIEGGTRVEHAEYFSGLLLPLMWGWMQQGVPPILLEMDRSLKSRVEG